MRLRKSPDFRRVQGRGQKIRLPDLLLLVLPGQGDRTRIGLTVSRKVGNAVVRNRVKRLLRENLRREYAIHADRWAQPGPGRPGSWDIVVIAHPSAADADLDRLGDQLRQGLAQVGARGAPRRDDRNPGQRRR